MVIVANIPSKAHFPYFNATHWIKLETNSFK